MCGSEAEDLKHLPLESCIHTPYKPLFLVIIRYFIEQYVIQC